MLSSKEERLLGDISGERARGYVSALVAIGEKVSGSQEEHKAARLLQEMLSPYVDTSELEGVPVTAYARRAARLEVISPLRREIPCEVNPLTASGRGEGLLVDGVNGTKGDYEKLGDLKGCVVLVNRDGVRHGGVTTHLALEAKNRGASCLVYHTLAAAEDLIHIWPVDTDFPVLSISNPAAAELRRLLREKEVRVRFEARIEPFQGTSYNVVGTLTGSRYPEEAIYLTGHYDNWFYGANDNTATVACLLEVARALKGYRPRHTLKFLFFGSEETGAPVGTWGLHGLIGSYGYCRSHRRELERALAMINGEVLGYTLRTHLQCTPELIPFAEGVAGDLGEHLRVSGPSFNWTLSDHLCFEAEGVPIIYLLPTKDLGTERRSTYWAIYHTKRDNLESVSARALEGNARLFALLALRLDAKGKPPYSLRSLIETALRGGERLPNRGRLERLLAEGKARCRGDREEALRQTLRFIRAVGRKIFAFNRPFGQRFEMIAERTARLKDAYYILEMEGDLERARAVLLTLPDFATARYFSEEAVAAVRKTREENAIIKELGLLETDWSELVACLSRPASRERILSALRAKIEEAEGMAQLWGKNLEEALKAL